ncbi:MAG TPA: hypothetical protein VL381_00290, partial [Rhodocyclaceae bacterium]|nr:hypothetical protein [Rhodocyclaceae bacterium]
MRYRLLLATLCYFLSNLAVAAEHPELPGVWRGSLGDRAVTVCFNRTYTSGAYYFHDELQPIQLSPLTDDAWQEKNGLWQFAEIKQGQTLGKWSETKGGPALAITLTRIPLAQNEDSDWACGSDEFNTALEGKLEQTTGPIQKIKGIAYQEVSISLDGFKHQEAGVGMSQQTLHLQGSAPALIPINTWLADQMSSESLFICRR